MILAMNIKQIPYTLAAMLWASFPVLAGAQPAKAPPSVRFSCVVWKELSYPGIFYRQNERFLPLALLARERSEMYSLDGHETLELYIAKDQPSGEPGHELVGRAALPQGAKQLLFMIQEAPEGSKLPLRVFGMDDSLEAFPPGAFRFLNFTSLPLQVEFGGSTTKLPPQAIKVVRPEIPELGGFLPFIVKDAQGHIGFQTRLFGQPRGRKIVMLVPPTKQEENLSVLFLPQIVPIPPPEEDSKSPQ
jgi:hypothetical protein